MRDYIPAFYMDLLLTHALILMLVYDGLVQI